MPSKQLGEPKSPAIPQNGEDAAIKPAKSLRFRISLTLGAIVAAIFLFATLLAGWNSYVEQVSASKTHFKGVAAILATSVAKDFREKNRPAVLQSLTAIRGINEISYVTIADSEGKRFAEIGSGSYLKSEEQEIEDLSPFELLVLNRSWIHHEIVQAGSKIGDIYMLTDLSGVRNNVLKSIAINVSIAALAGLVSIFIALKSVSRILAPLTGLSQLMRGIGDDGKYTERAAIDGKGEIAALAQSFNSMASQIQRRDAQLTEYQLNLENMVQTRTEELKIARDDAVSANQAKSEFLATVSHEIRTPMNGIMIMAELMSDAPMSGRQRRYANIIRQSGAGMLAIINDLLDLSKIEAGKMELDPAEIDPDSIVIGVAGLLWENAASKQVDLSCYVSSGIPDKILADSIRLSQIITNLVGNAIKFTSNGSVSVEVNSIAPLDPARTRLRFEVTDTGLGIPADRIDSIFNRFEQADKSTSKDYGGTGLGLSICKKLVRAMDGDIGVVSEPGKGSTFWFEIEVDAVASDGSAVNHVADDMPVRADHKNITIICSSKGNLLALTRGFEDLGHSVTRQERLDPGGISKGEFDAILCEPDVALKLHGESPNTPLIALTTMGDNEQELREAVPYCDLLILPCGRKQLKEVKLESSSDTDESISSFTADNAEHLKPEFAGINVLGVDDNLVNRTVLRDALNRLGATVETATSGPDALRIIEDRHFDLIFMDCSMPQMDGFQATAAIRELEGKSQTKRIPIIALTAHISGPEAERWREADMDGYLAKPFTMKSLSGALSQALDKTPQVEMNSAEERTAERRKSDIPGDKTSSEDVDIPEQLIDPKTMELLASLGHKSGTSAASRIFGLYLSTADPALEELAAIISEESAQNFARAVHNFKSMSLSSGASAVAAIAQQMETLANKGEVRRAGERIQELEDVYAHTRDAMNKLIDGSKSEEHSVAVNS
ncbi:MAG: ATP-binding protein [Rhizobiaceae bacterium]